MTILNANREDLILGAAGLSSARSPWLVYHILSGTQVDKVQEEAPMQAHMRRSLVQFLAHQYGATVVVDEFQTTFTGDFDIEPYMRVAEPGELPCSKGDVLLLEMVEQNTLKFAWKVSYEVVLPWTVRARANIRMHACGAANALVWVVSDNGAFDQMHPVPYDPSMVQHLVAGCGKMALRLREGDEPDPSDEDLNRSIDFTAIGAGGNSTLEVKEGEDLHKTFESYTALLAESQAAYQAKERADGAVSAVRTQLLRQLDKTPHIVFPDGRRLTATTIKKKAGVTRASQYQKLVITGADPKATEG